MGIVARKKQATWHGIEWTQIVRHFRNDFMIVFVIGIAASIVIFFSGIKILKLKSIMKIFLIEILKDDYNDKNNILNYERINKLIKDDDLLKKYRDMKLQVRVYGSIFMLFLMVILFMSYYCKI